jgi:hypothetical protein
LLSHCLLLQGTALGNRLIEVATMAQSHDIKQISTASTAMTGSATSTLSRDDDSQFIPLSRAAKHLPDRVNTSTVWRWCRKGVLARSGRRVFLRHSRLGGRIYVTQDWIDAFGQALADEDAQHFAARDEVPAWRGTSPAPCQLSSPTLASGRTVHNPDSLRAELQAEGL